MFKKKYYLCKKITKMGNQQLYTLKNCELQVVLSLYLGDGCFISNKANTSAAIATSCKYEEYLLYKKNLISTLDNSNVSYSTNNGYKNSFIYKWKINQSPYLKEIEQIPLIDKLEILDELGLALWFYDDGSLHKSKYFYNLNTHTFSLEDQYLFLDKLSKYGINAKIYKDRKKDGREFFYLSIGKHQGSSIISDFLNKINIDCYKYKRWSSSTS